MLTARYLTELAERAPGDMAMEKERRVETMDDEQKRLGEQSPSEKLETETPISPPTPGAENSDSEGVKEETSPNTE
jgi:hypothetical protein